jgi:hypothetical protein
MPKENKEKQDVTAATTAAPATVNPEVNRLNMMPVMSYFPIITWVPLYGGFNMNLNDPVSQVRQIVREVMYEEGMVKDSSITKK